MMQHLRTSPSLASLLPPAMLTWLLAPALALGAGRSPLRVEPTKVILNNPEATQQLLVTGGEPAAPVDRTRTASYHVADPRIAEVDSTGLVIPRAEGRTEIVIRDK